MEKSFKEAFEEICFATTSNYLHKMEQTSEEFQRLDKKSKKLFLKIRKALTDEEILDCYEDIENAKGCLYLQWAYQKALYDYTYLLTKLGFVLPEVAATESIEFSIEKQLYKRLECIAKKRNVSVDHLVSKYLRSLLEHPEKIIENMEVKTGGEQSEPAARE